MKTWSIISLLLLTYCVHSQGIDPIFQFEKDLNIFRYSLYAELDSLDEEKLRRFDFNDTDSVILRINEFYEQNEARIKQYRRYQLEKYVSFKIDSSVYSSSPYFTSDAVPEEFVNEFSTHPLAKLVFIHPLLQTQTLRTIIIARELSPTEFANQAMKNQVAQPLIQTKKINENNWEINLDHYDQLFKFKYNPESANISKIEIYKRKD